MTSPPAAPEADEPSSWIASLFRRPPRAGEDERLFAVLKDGRIVQVALLDEDEEPELPGVA